MDNPKRERLGAILEGLVQRHGLDRARWITVIESLWTETVGEVIAMHSCVMTLTKDGTLVVAVPSSVWAQELQYQKPVIIDIIRKTLPQACVRDVKTRVRAFVMGPRADAAVLQASPYFSTQACVPSTENLRELLDRVQEKYEVAAQIWIGQGLARCTRCQAPTGAGYLLCSVCEQDRHRQS